MKINLESSFIVFTIFLATSAFGQDIYFKYLKTHIVVNSNGSEKVKLIDSSIGNFKFETVEKDKNLLIILDMSKTRPFETWQWYKWKKDEGYIERNNKYFKKSLRLNVEKNTEAYFFYAVDSSSVLIFCADDTVLEYYN